MESSPSVIKEFVDHYNQKLDFYNHLAAMVAEQLRSELVRRGIRAIVTSRAKDPERLRDKLAQRVTRTKNPKAYKTLKDVESDIVDLAGVRVALYFPGDQDKVAQLIERIFEPTEPAKQFPEEDAERHAKGLMGYIARHHRVKLRRNRVSNSQRRYADARVEIQVASVLMHAWAEIDHDLRYKPTQGNPSQDELATLDEVNGLVLTGEIALERLQRSIESRVGIPDYRFQNAYELQDFLSAQTTADLSHEEIGRVNYLFQLIKNASLDSPRDLKHYLDQIVTISDEEPLADQLIDAITSEDPERYHLFMSVLSDERENQNARELQDDSRAALGEFLTEWIKLEHLLRTLIGSSTTIFLGVLRSRLLDSGVPPAITEEIYALRVLRNKLLHGQMILPASEMREASERIRTAARNTEEILQSKGTAPARKSKSRKKGKASQ